MAKHEWDWHRTGREGLASDLSVILQAMWFWNGDTEYHVVYAIRERLLDALNACRGAG